MALTCCGYQSLFKLLHALSRICFRLQEKDPRYFFLNHFSCKLNYASVIYSSWGFINQLSMDWFKGKNTGKPHISWENLWLPVDFPFSQLKLIEPGGHNIEATDQSQVLPSLLLALFLFLVLLLFPAGDAECQKIMFHSFNGNLRILKWRYCTI